MTAVFRVLTTPTFEREFRRTSRGDSTLLQALEELLTVLRQDPHNRTGQHKIKKPAGLKADKGQWRIRWREYRLRYDIFGNEVVFAFVPSSEGSVLGDGVVPQFRTPGLGLHGRLQHPR